MIKRGHPTTRPPDDWLTVWFMRRFNWTPSQVRGEDATELMRLRSMIIEIERTERK